MSNLKLLCCTLSLVALAGCEQLGFEDPAKLAAAKEAEGKAIGSACRQSARALEDCYALNPRAQKAAIFAGWREMDAYMRETKIEAVTPQIVEDRATGKEAPAAAAAPDKAEANGTAAKASKPAAK